MKAYLINLVVFSMLVMFAMANEDTEENSWLWTAGKLVGGLIPFLSPISIV